MSRAKPDDSDLSILFKHGIHTVLMLIDPLEPFSKVTEELLEVLRERYPEGLTASVTPLKTTPVPTSSEDVHVSYAVLKSPNDPSQGWKNLRIKGTETPVEKDLKDNCVVAFAILPADEPGDDANFEVEWPRLDDEDGMDEG